MKILATVNIDKSKNKLIVIDTEKKNYINYSLGIRDKFEIFGALAYSGNFLIISVYNYIFNDRLIIVDLFNNKKIIYPCSLSTHINSIVSIYPGKLYVNSYKDNSMNSITFDINSMDVLGEDIHYKVNYGILDYLYCYKTKWYSCLFINNEQGVILEFDNDRFVYSSIDYPTCLFFNENHRLCFLERNKGLFHYEDNIIYVGNNPFSVLEDVYNGGYWISFKKQIKFFDYTGNLKDAVLFPDNFVINNLLEAKGKFYNGQIS